MPLLLLVLTAIAGVGVFVWLQNTEEETDKPNPVTKKANDPREEPVSLVDTINGGITNRGGHEERVFRLRLPRGVWASDKEVKEGLKAVVAYQRSDPFVWLAVAVQDYGGRMPRDAELFTEALQRLRRHFRISLQVAGSSEKTEVPGLPGVPAQKMEFKGKVNEVTWRGECYMLAQNGVGYFYYLASAPRLETALETLASLQKEKGNGFQLVPIRKGWAEQPPEMETFEDAKSGIEFAAPKGVWDKKFKAAPIDPSGVFYLQGRDPKEVDPTLKNIKAARILVLHYQKTKDVKEALKEARETLLKRLQGQANNDKLELKPAANKPAALMRTRGSCRRSATKKGWCWNYGSNMDEEPQAASCCWPWSPSPTTWWCSSAIATGDYHQIWRSDFLNLLATFRQKKPAS